MDDVTSVEVEETVVVVGTTTGEDVETTTVEVVVIVLVLTVSVVEETKGTVEVGRDPLSTLPQPVTVNSKPDKNTKVKICRILIFE